MSERKPDHQRVRRAAPELPWTDLPAEGRSEYPDPPELGKHGDGWWHRNWRTPSATQWGPAEFDLAVRRAELEDAWKSTKDPKYLAEMRHLETALGLTPKARKELRWRVAEGDVVVEENGRPVPAAERRKRLKVV